MIATESNGVDQLDARDDDQLLFDELGETRIEAQKRWLDVGFLTGPLKIDDARIQATGTFKMWQADR